MLAHVVSCFVFFRSLLFICSAIFFFFYSCVEKSLRTFWLTITEVSTQ